MTYRERVLNLPKPSPVDIDGLLAFHRAAFGDMRMDGEGAAGGEAGGQATGGATLTQADVNAIVAREADKAKNAALSQVASDLGVSIDEAKQIIADRKATDDARKTEAERDREAAATAKAEADRYKAQAAQDLHDSRVEVALARAGVDLDNDVLRRAAIAAVDVPLGAEPDVIKAAVDKAKTDAPALFAATTGSGSGGTHSDAGGQRSKEQQTGGEFGSRGAQEAARRWNTGSKSA